MQLGEAAGNGAPAAGDDVATESKPAAAKGKSKRKTKAKAEPVAKPKRISLPRGMDPETLDLDKALSLLALPRSLGPHPDTGQEISAGLGRFGPYLRMGDTYVSLKGDDDVLEIGLNRAVDLLSRARPAKAKGKTLGTHPEDDKPVMLMAGRYGPYVEHGKLRATLPAGVDAETIELEPALALLAEKQGRSAAGKPGKAAAKPPLKAATKAKATRAPAAKTTKSLTLEAGEMKPARRKKAAGSP